VQLGRVIGQVVATIKDPALEGLRLFVVQGLDEHLRAVGRPFAAVDALACSGPGDLVYFVQKRDAAIALGDRPPIDAAIIGFVDEVAAEQTPGGPMLVHKG
jgi:ethanolamine utilization protein EutN